MTPVSLTHCVTLPFEVPCSLRLSHCLRRASAVFQPPLVVLVCSFWAVVQSILAASLLMQPGCRTHLQRQPSFEGDQGMR